jgi:hypothetical protein
MGARGRSGEVLGEPQVEQRGVIAQLTADVVEQVVAQELGQTRTSLGVGLVSARPGGSRAEGGGALRQGVGAAVLVVGLADAVGIEEHAVARAGTEEVGAGRVAAEVEQAERRRRRQRVEERRLAAAQQQGRRVAAADDQGLPVVAVRHGDELGGDELLPVRVAGDERVQPRRDDLQRVRVDGDLTEGAGNFGRGPGGARVMSHHVADEQADAVRNDDGAGDIAAGDVFAMGVATVRRHWAGSPREGTAHVSARG